MRCPTKDCKGEVRHGVCEICKKYCGWMVSDEYSDSNQCSDPGEIQKVNYDR